MAVTLRAKSTGVDGAVTKPTGATSGDLLVVVAGSDAVPTAGLSGFTLAGSATANSKSLYVYWKIAGASEPASYSMTYTTGTSYCLHAFAYSSGFNASSPVSAPVFASGAAGTAQTAPSVSPTASGSTLMCSWAESGGTYSYTEPTGMTKQADTNDTWLVVATASQDLTSTAATGGKTATPSTSAAWHATSFLINGAASTSTTVTPNLVSATAAAQPPTVVSTVTAAPARVSTAPQALAPTVLPGAATVTPALVLSSPTAPAPSVQASTTVTPGVASGSVAAFAPSALVIGAVTPGLASTVPQAFSPTVVPGAVTVAPGIAAVQLQAYPPGVVASVVISFGSGGLGDGPFGQAPFGAAGADLPVPGSAPQAFEPSVELLPHVVVPELAVSSPQAFPPIGPPVAPALVWFWDQRLQNWFPAEISFYSKSSRRWARADVEIIGAP